MIDMFIAGAEARGEGEGPKRGLGEPGIRALLRQAVEQGRHGQDVASPGVFEEG